MLAWHADDLARRRPLNRIKALVARLGGEAPTTFPRLTWPGRRDGDVRVDAAAAPGGADARRNPLRAAAAFFRRALGKQA